MTNGLEYYNACWCAGTGCGGHLVLAPAKLDITGWTPFGWRVRRSTRLSPLAQVFTSRPRRRHSRRYGWSPGTVPSQVIAFTVSGLRQKYLREALGTWGRARGIEDWHLLFSLEPCRTTFPVPELLPGEARLRLGRGGRRRFSPRLPAQHPAGDAAGVRVRRGVRHPGRGGPAGQHRRAGVFHVGQGCLRRR